uniref:hypothetical protein n=1 Tax=uncultured Draconibacterium sp. TaxID=1573823 RepID=UPI0032180CD8
MKKLKFVTILLLLSLIIACEKDDESEKYEIDNDVEYYKDYVPDLVIQKNDSVPIDVDNDGSMDIVIIWTDPKEIKCLNDNIRFSHGKYPGSATANLNIIEFNEIIGESLDWFSFDILYPNSIEYVGLRKKVKEKYNTNLSLYYYGWIKISVEEETVTIRELYFRKEPDTVIRAGITSYE